MRPKPRRSRGGIVFVPTHSAKNAEWMGHSERLRGHSERLRGNGERLIGRGEMPAGVR
jgi:hypothetical protein